jgi:adenylate cyclase
VLAALTVLVASFSPLSPLDRLNALVFDAYQNLRPRPAFDAPLVVVDIDERSIMALGQWPWPRTVLGQIVDNLDGMGAAAIGIDLLLSEPDRTSPAAALSQLRAQGFRIIPPSKGAVLDNDRNLAESFAGAPVITGLALTGTTGNTPPPAKWGFAFAGVDPSTYLDGYRGSLRNLPGFDEAASGVGVVNFSPARDGVVRQVPLIARLDTQFYPGLALETLRVAQGASTYLIRSTGSQGEKNTGEPGMVSVRVGDFDVPTGPDGLMWLYYSPQLSAQIIPAYRLASTTRDGGLAEAISGRIVLIGASAIGLRNLVSTPLSAATPGVMVHAAAIEQILSRQFLGRPDWATGAEVTMAIVLTVLVLGLLPWLPSLANVIIVSSALALSLLLGWYAFASFKFLLSPILPALCALLAYGVASGVRLLFSESEKRYIRDAFAHYLSPSMVQQLMDNPNILNLGGENRELTLLFCDIRGFTSLSEGLEPSEVTEFLNKFLTPMTDVLMRHGATIDKYTGDGIMAFWNAPITTPDHRRVACAAVLALQDELRNFNAGSARQVSMGIGLNTGICCVGNLGSEHRFDYSAIGDAVNIAARVEAMTKTYQLTNLVSESTAAAAEGFALIEVDSVRLTGRGTPTRLFTVLGDTDYARSKEFTAFKRLHDSFLEHCRSKQQSAARGELRQILKMAPPQLEPLYASYRSRFGLDRHGSRHRADTRGVVVPLHK